MCSHRKDLARAWSTHGTRDHLVYMDFVRTQDFIAFHEVMIMDTELCCIFAFWACTLRTMWPDDQSLISTVTSKSLEILVWIPHHWYQAPRESRKRAVQEIHATGRRLIYYIIPISYIWPKFHCDYVTALDKQLWWSSNNMFWLLV
jgi:hypothetical protein